MVGRLLILTLMVALSCFASEIVVDVDISGESPTVDGQIEGTIRVSSPEALEVDRNSFCLEGKSLSVESLGESVRSSLTIINGVRSERRTICHSYRFTFPKGETGNHELPPITVRVGGRLYASRPTSYFVCATEQSEQFRMEALVRGKTVLYPGEKAEFVIRLIFRNPIELTDDAFPLLDSEGFRRIGERKVKHDFQGRLTIQEVSQEVQAVTPGEHNFGTSYVEGLPYKKDFFGHRTYERRKLRAEAPPLTVTVLNFPAEGRPDGFDGALGAFAIRTRLLGSDKVAVGDRVRLEVTVSGTGEMSTLRCPDLRRQPEFRKLFRISDLPPVVEERPGQKRFVLEMRPLSEAITEIPAVSLSSFDTTTRVYREAVSRAIPLRVTQLQKSELVQEVAEPSPVVAPPFEESGGWRSEWERVRENAICCCYPLDGLKPAMPQWWLLGLWPLSVVGLLLQRELVRRLAQGKSRRKGAKELFASAENLGDLEQALMTGLVASGIIGTSCAPEHLPLEGVVGEARRLLLELEAVQYDVDRPQGDVGCLWHKARELLERLET